MRDRHHRLRVNSAVGLRQDLLGRPTSLELEAGTARAAHAKRVPTALMLEAVVVLEHRNQDLIGWRCVHSATCGRNDTVGLRPVGHHGGILDQTDAGPLGLYRTVALAQVAATLAIRRRGRQQQLLVAKPAQQPAMPCAGARVTDQARHHDLVHGVDHAGRRAGPRKRVAGIDDAGQLHALAAEIERNHDAEQTRGLGGRQRLTGIPGLAIDRIDIGGGHSRDRTGAASEILLGGSEVQRRRLDRIEGVARAKQGGGSRIDLSQSHHTASFARHPVRCLCLTMSQ